MVLRAPSHQTIRATFRGKAAHAGLDPERGRSAVVAASRAIAAMRLGRLDAETTANVGTIKGGTATNIVPDLCVVEAECRSHEEGALAGITAEMVEAFQHGATETEVDVEITLNRDYSGFSLSPRSRVARLGKAALRAVGVEPRVLSSTGGSDANALNSRGVPTVNLDCGMVAVHSADEHIPLAELVRLTHLVLALIRLAPEYGRAGG
jgi:tripeptide aminopeptidase